MSSSINRESSSNESNTSDDNFLEYITDLNNLVTVTNENIIFQNHNRKKEFIQHLKTLLDNITDYTGTNNEYIRIKEIIYSDLKKTFAKSNNVNNAFTALIPNHATHILTHYKNLMETIELPHINNRNMRFSSNEMENTTYTRNEIQKKEAIEKIIKAFKKKLDLNNTKLDFESNLNDNFNPLYEKLTELLGAPHKYTPLETFGHEISKATGFFTKSHYSANNLERAQQNRNSKGNSKLINDIGIVEQMAFFVYAIKKYNNAIEDKLNEKNSFDKTKIQCINIITVFLLFCEEIHYTETKISYNESNVYSVCLDLLKDELKPVSEYKGIDLNKVIEALTKISNAEYKLKTFEKSGTWHNFEEIKAKFDEITAANKKREESIHMSDDDKKVHYRNMLKLHEKTVKQLETQVKNKANDPNAKLTNDLMQLYKEERLRLANEIKTKHKAINIAAAEAEEARKRERANEVRKIDEKGAEMLKELNAAREKKELEAEAKRKELEEEMKGKRAANNKYAPTLTHVEQLLKEEKERKAASRKLFDDRQKANEERRGELEKEAKKLETKEKEYLKKVEEARAAHKGEEYKGKNTGEKAPEAGLVKTQKQKFTKPPEQKVKESVRVGSLVVPVFKGTENKNKTPRKVGAYTGNNNDGVKSAKAYRDMKDAEEAARKAEQQRNAKAQKEKGAAARRKYMALVASEEKKNPASHPPKETYVTQKKEKNELLKDFLDWLSNQPGVLIPVTSITKNRENIIKRNNDIKKFIKDLYELYLSATGNKLSLTGEQNILLSDLINNIRKTDGIDSYVNNYSTSKGISTEPRHSLISIMKLSILKQDVKPVRGGAGKLLTKRRKLSNRLQTKKRRV